MKNWQHTNVLDMDIQEQLFYGENADLNFNHFAWLPAFNKRSLKQHF